MSCGTCGTGNGGCKSNGTCGTEGCNKLNTFDWLKDVALPEDYQPFDIVEVQFKGSRKEFFQNSEQLSLITGDTVVVESEPGHDVGHVSLSGELVRLQLKKQRVEELDKFKKIYRVASTKDVDKYREMKEKEAHTLERARTIAMQMALEMKLSDIEFQGDGRKVIFFYTAESRVDFRELIRRYATEFKTRIEMRQVSYREEASRLGGIGSCGLVLCCSTWLTDYKVVTVNSARTQNLSINMLKLSGQCGRLKCCLNYELETYLDALSEYPKGDKIVLETKAGKAYLTKTDILKRVMWFSYPKKSEWLALDLERVKEVLELNKNGELPETLVSASSLALAEAVFDEPVDLISDNSLTRLDKKYEDRRKSNKKRKGRRNPKNRSKNNPKQDTSGSPQPQNKGPRKQGNSSNTNSGRPNQNRRNKNRKPGNRPPKSPDKT
jgi:cell fate regulator YaaT (PSP1 superfamily)